MQHLPGQSRVSWSSASPPSSNTHEGLGRPIIGGRTWPPPGAQGVTAARNGQKKWFLALKFRPWAGGRSADDGRWHNVCGGLRADGGMGVTVPAIGKLRTAPSQCEWLARLGVQLEWRSGSETVVRGLGMAANWEAQLDLVCSVFSQDWCALLPRRLRAGGAGYERGLCLCRLSGHCSTALQMGALRRCGAGSFRSWPWVVLGGGW